MALVLYAVLALPTCAIAGHLGQPEVWLALAAVPVAVLARDRPWIFGVALVAGAAWLRVVYAAQPLTSDQVPVGQAAAEVAFSGGNPYGRGYAESVPPGASFAYGPLMLVWSLGGVWSEVLFDAGTLVLLTATRAWLTLSVYGPVVLVVDLATAGINDLSAGFFITAGLLALRRDRVIGALLLAVAAATKPYALAWFPGAIGFGGLAVAVPLVAATAVLWAPVLWWGPGSVLRSFEIARDVHPIPENTLNRPELRVLAVPVALASLLARRWWLVVVSGAAVFVLVLFLDRWASRGYLLAIAPILGIALEEAVRRLVWATRGRVPAAAP